MAGNSKNSQDDLLPSGDEEGEEEEDDDDDEHQFVGKSELMVESELIGLMESANKLERDGFYAEAIKALQKAMIIADFKGGLEKKINELKSKIDLAAQEEMEQEGFDLDKELAELSEEATKQISQEELPPSVFDPDNKDQNKDQNKE